MKKILLLILAISLINGNNCYADNVTLLDKGTPTPFKGYLFPEEDTRLLKAQLQELDNLRLMIESYNKSISLYKANEKEYTDKVNILLEQNDKLSKALYSSKDREEYSKITWFALGFLMTSVGVYIGSHANK